MVGINDDASVTRLKGSGRPILPLDQRLRVLAGLASVDYVIAFPEDTPLELLQAVRPDVLVKGGDYQVSEVVGHREVQEWGGRVELAPPLQGVSTKQVIHRILSTFGPGKLQQPGHSSNSKR